MNSTSLNLPSMRCLQAFETAARLSSFTAAASALHTSQSSISRHIADLEKSVGGQLFIREKQRVRLSDRGEHLFRSVSHGLESIRSGVRVVADWTPPSRVTIACTHAISHLLLMPVFESLNEAMRDTAQVRILSYEYETVETTPDPQMDIVFEYGEYNSGSPYRVKILPEAVTPLCSPEFAEQHKAILSGPVSDWQSLPLLGMEVPNRGWATWNDWLRNKGIERSTVHPVNFENYVYLLEAAADGRGIALGGRGLVERYLASNRLIALTDTHYETDRALYAVLTERGESSSEARYCLNQLATLLID